MTNRTAHRLIGAYELVAGAIGVVLAFLAFGRLLPQVPADSKGAVGLVLIGMAALFAAVTVAGILLLEGHPAGRPFSSVIQLLQSVYLVVPGAHWVFHAGAYLGVVWVNGWPNLAYGLKSELQVAWGAAPAATLIGFNVVPWFVLWYLWRPEPGTEARWEDRPSESGSPAA